MVEHRGLLFYNEELYLLGYNAVSEKHVVSIFKMEQGEC
jgi:hypothetical protein